MKTVIKKIELKDLDAFFEFFQKTVISEFPEYSKGDLEYIFTKLIQKPKKENYLR